MFISNQQAIFAVDLTYLALGYTEMSAETQEMQRANCLLRGKPS